MEFFAGLLVPTVAIAEAPVSDATAGLDPAELASLVAAVPRRRAEFSTGRKCARQAMAALGLPTVSLPPEPDRTPRWPSGVVGSITHTLQHCAAAVARRSDGVAAIGIDLEPATALPEGLWENICSADELAAAARSGLPDDLLPRLVFGAKEAAFKAQFTLSRTMLEFSDLTVAFKDDGTYAATFQRDVTHFNGGTAVSGRFRLADAHIACAVVIDG